MLLEEGEKKRRKQKKTKKRKEKRGKGGGGTIEKRSIWISWKDVPLKRNEGFFWKLF